VDDDRPPLVARFVYDLNPARLDDVEGEAAFPGSALGGLGSLLSALLGLANIAVALLATGWAMSRTALAQSGNFFDTVPASMQDPLGPTVSSPRWSRRSSPVAAHPVAVAAPACRAAHGGRLALRRSPRRLLWPPSATRASGSAQAQPTRPNSKGHRLVLPHLRLERSRR
jgi:hypothetical protein